MLKFILATIILVSFSIDALEINYEDGALVDDFVDEYPAIRELDVDQEDDDQLLPEKVTRAASWKLRGGKSSANDDIKRDTLWKLRGGKRADDLYKREALWNLRTGKRGLWKLRGGKRSGT